MNKKHFLKFSFVVSLFFVGGILLLITIAYNDKAQAGMTLSERIQAIQGR